jgi:hypothetical protein
MPRRAMRKRNEKSSSIMLKKTAMLIAACTFVFGFIAGMGFTVYKTNSAPSNTADKG